MAENKRLSDELAALGGGLAGATVGSLLLENRALEVKIHLPNNRVGRVAFAEVEAVQFRGPSDAILSGAAVFAADGLPEHAPGREIVLWKHVLYREESQAVLEVLAESFSLTELSSARGWTQVLDFCERNWDRQGAEAWTKTLESFPPGYRGSFCIYWIDSEQPRQGFAGVLSNATRRIFEHAIACYQRLDQTRMAAILQSALIVSGAETPELWEVPPTAVEFGLAEPLTVEFDELDVFYAAERELLPAAEGVENNEWLAGTIEYYWQTFPADFQTGPDEAGEGKAGGSSRAASG
jgi:hypothetical protein